MPDARRVVVVGPAARGVVVVGSLHLDVVVSAPRLPRLGETLQGTGFALACGGKGGNQAVEAARHGAATSMVARIGQDAFGDRLLENLAAAGVDVGRVRRTGRGSGMSAALLDAQGDYGAVIVSGANQDLGADDPDLDAAAFRGAAVVVLQNEIAAPANLAAARGAAAASALVVLNAAPVRPLGAALASRVGLLVVNAVEAEMLGTAPVGGADDALRAARQLGLSFPAVIVTAGAAGLAVRTPSEEHLLAAHEVAVASTHGAGDAFIGALAARLAAGEALVAAARYANAAAAVLVATPAPARAGLRAADTERLLEGHSVSRA